MTSESLSPAATSIDPTQRKLMVGIVITTLVLLAIVIAALARGGRPDPPALRAAATLLDGNWHFRTGDDPSWAAPGTDVTDWQTIDLTAPPGSHDDDVGLPDYVSGWGSYGHPGYHGYAWYRRTVAVPVPGEHASWVILGPTLVEDGYELYWNGKLLGGSGRLGPDPRVVGTRPLLFALPADVAGTTGVLAIRTFMLSRSSATGGGMHTAPILAPQPAGSALHRAQWERTIAGYLVDAIEPLAMLALVGLALACWLRSSHKGFLVFACIALVLTAERRLNNAIVSWTDLESLRTYSWLVRWMWLPMMATWVLAWNRWCRRPWRSIDALAVALTVVGIIGILVDSAIMISVCRLGSLALFVVIAARMARSGPMRILALVTLASIVAALFGRELLDTIGLRGIWFPFGIGVSRTQYIYAIAIPLLAFLIVRTLDSRRNVTTSDATLAPQTDSS